MKRILSSLCWLTVACVLAKSTYAQHNIEGRFPVTTYEAPYLFLIRDPVVHEDLELTTTQIKSLTALNDRLDMPLWSMRNKSAQHSTKTAKDVTALSQQRLSKILTSQQLKRLKQIEYWTLGMRAFSRAEVVDQLGLSDEQSKKAREVLAKTASAIKNLHQELRAGASRELLNKKADQLRIDEQKQVLAELSSNQQQKLTAIIGKKIDVARLGRIKMKAPELQPSDTWINSNPLTLEQLKGKVVALHFYAFA